MPYEFKRTERNLGRGAEFETKSLLYLLGVDKNRGKISYVFVDCFNDVSGTDQNCQTLWDYQAKGVSTLGPERIGRSLITLYLNYVSELKFSKYVLFMPQPPSEYLADESLREFSIANFSVIQKKIFTGLDKELRAAACLPHTTKEQKASIASFLKEVVFVVDDGCKADYVKQLICFKRKDLKPDVFFEAIFEEIKVQQLGKKAIRIHGEKIETIRQALGFEKHFQAKDITVLVINRLIGVDVFSHRAVPFGFLPVVNGQSQSEIKDVIQQCNTDIARAFFDKNGKGTFWRTLESAIVAVTGHPNTGVQQILDKLTDNQIMTSGYLSGTTGLYLLSLLQEGLSNESD